MNKPQIDFAYGSFSIKNREVYVDQETSDSVSVRWLADGVLMVAIAPGVLDFSRGVRLQMNIKPASDGGADLNQRVEIVHSDISHTTVYLFTYRGFDAKDYGAAYPGAFDFKNPTQVAQWLNEMIWHLQACGAAMCDPGRIEFFVGYQPDSVS